MGWFMVLGTCVEEDCLVRPQWERIHLILWKLLAPGLRVVVGLMWGGGGR